MFLSWKKALVPVATIFMITGCHIEIDDDPEDEESETTYGANYQLGDGVTECSLGAYESTHTASYDNSSATYFCYEKENRTWMANCQSDQCELLQVNVHYMLPNDLGTNNTVIVEAFDNSHFTGRPVSTLEMTDFDASRPGTHSDDVVYLEPGDYFFRAYIATQGAITPYEYGGMQLVSDQPVGLYGAASGPVKVTVWDEAERTLQQPINIYLTELFKKEGVGEDTDAHLRISMTVAADAQIPYGRKVLVQLFDKEDFDFSPVYQFEVASETFLIEGRRGQSEFISPELKEGRYFVRAFLDNSQNGYPETDELQATYMKSGEKGIVAIVKKRTASVALPLALPQ
jgi:hypothetical protein